MPYWDYDADTETGEYFDDPENSIFSDNFFGDYAPAGSGTVTNGLFAYWPVSVYTSEKYGAESDLNTMCANQEWFKGTQATTCPRCCGKQWWQCHCWFWEEESPVFLRDHDDCNPYVARAPYSGARFQGTCK